MAKPYQYAPKSFSTLLVVAPGKLGFGEAQVDQSIPLNEVMKFSHCNAGLPLFLLGTINTFKIPGHQGRNTLLNQPSHLTQHLLLPIIHACIDT